VGILFPPDSGNSSPYGNSLRGDPTPPAYDRSAMQNGTSCGNGGVLVAVSTGSGPGRGSPGPFHEQAPVDPGSSLASGDRGFMVGEMPGLGAGG
jgi:hypothetical protein